VLGVLVKKEVKMFEMTLTSAHSCFVGFVDLMVISVELYTDVVMSVYFATFCYPLQLTTVSVCLSVSLSVSMSVCLSVCLFSLVSVNQTTWLIESSVPLLQMLKVAGSTKIL